jgi:hypothetical protein
MSFIFIVVLRKRWTPKDVATVKGLNNVDHRTRCKENCRTLLTDKPISTLLTLKCIIFN